MDTMPTSQPTLRFRSVFISDVQLGFKGCRAEFLLDFLRRGVHGVICGHIHRAAISDIDGITYCNDGDWVESCTTLVEDFQGRLSLLRWTETVEVLVGSQTLPLLDGTVALEPAA